jgi:hypothetical protein
MYPSCVRILLKLLSCITGTALAGQSQLDLSASDNFRFGGARGVESQLASSSALRSQGRQQSSLSIYQTHSSSQVTEQKETMSSSVQSQGREQSQSNNFQAQQNSIASMASQQQASASSGGQIQERQNPDFRSRRVFTSRTIKPTTTAPPYVPPPREYNQCRFVMGTVHDVILKLVCTDSMCEKNVSSRDEVHHQRSSFS